MKNIGVIALIVVVVLTTGFTKKGFWIIDANSVLTIYGSTNVNNFSCKMDCYIGGDTLQYVRNNTGYDLSSNSPMTIPVNGFECNTRQISSDFRKALKAETYPQLNINFKSLQNPTNTNNSCVNGIVDITLAGVTTRYTIQFNVVRNEQNTILLKGVHPVAFSDFNLEAPEKLSGLIKVREVLNVDFNLVLREI
jgi:hypothetical protein